MTLPKNRPAVHASALMVVRAERRHPHIRDPATRRVRRLIFRAPALTKLLRELGSWDARFVLLASIFTVNLLAMFTRRYAVPDHSFFLFGPRWTGKTTWLRQVWPDALWFDLLRTH